MFDLERALIEPRADPDRRVGGEPAVVQQLDVEDAFAEACMKASADPVPRMDQELVVVLFQHTGKSDAAE